MQNKVTPPGERVENHSVFSGTLRSAYCMSRPSVRLSSVCLSVVYNVVAP